VDGALPAEGRRPTTATSPGETLGVAPFGVQPLRGIRRLTAEAMARSWSEIPHITGMDEVDATALLDARRRLRELAGDGTPHLTPLALLALAVVSALRRFPLVNASLDREAGTIAVHEHVNLGIAVATDAGLVVPVVTDADRRGLSGLAAEMARLADAARSHTVSPGELRGGTFTITNYGSLGGRFATPIIRPGEVGIMGFGAIRPRPVVADGVVEARPTLPIVFSADHRLIDGDLATAFQEHVIARVREPLSLLLEV
jgi:pyruvate dehydrogenase E2 component (dihydrolipoamide acetyltransferase)